MKIKIVPKPVNIRMGKGYYIFDKHTDIIYNNVNSAHVANYLIDRIKQLYGFKLQACEYHSYKYAKEIVFDEVKDYKSKKGYELTIQKDTIVILGRKQGLINGMKILLQLFPANKKIIPFKIPFLTIKDYSRFY